MSWSKTLVTRPVLACVISLFIFILGLRAYAELEIRQYPQTKDTVIRIDTSYPGASSELIKGFVTTPLQQAIAQAEGIDYLFSTSRQGQSSIEARLKLNYDENAAIADIQAKVASQKGNLPQGALDPIITSQTGSSTALMYIAFYSETLSSPEVSDYLLRVAQPQLQSIEGVGEAALLGKNIYALRVWLDPQRMRALNITPNEINQALRQNNYLSNVGRTKGAYVSVDLGATTDLNNADDFLNLVVAKRGGTLIRLSDVAQAELGAESYDQQNLYNGKPAIFIAINEAPGANPLDVAAKVQTTLQSIEKNLPEGLNVQLPYDASKFIDDSIMEVGSTLVEALFIVIAVIFVSLGSARAAIVPAVTVPLSLVGAGLIMLLLGFSVNLLTLLAMILAIGLVVDDAIVMVENIHRHIEMGKSKTQAAIDGAKELNLPIIAMTTTLVAVYLPIGFMEGLVGSLFIEFAFSLAGAVLISGVVALTLSPMLSAKVLKPAGHFDLLEKRVNDFFQRLSKRYASLLTPCLNTPSVVIVFSLVIVISLYPMYMLTQKELAPVEDQSLLLSFSFAPQTANLNFVKEQTEHIITTHESIDEFEQGFILMGFGGKVNEVLAGLKMGPQNTRERSQSDVKPELQQKLSSIAGFQTAVIEQPSLPGSGGGFPIQFVLLSDENHRQLEQYADALIADAMQSGRFIFLKKSLQIDRPKSTFVIDKDRAADLNISMEDIGSSLSTLYGEGYINRFNMQGRSYKVIPQVRDHDRFDVEQLNKINLNTPSGQQVPLSSLVRVIDTVEPSSQTQFQQLNSITVEGLLRPDMTMGEGLDYLDQYASENFSKSVRWDYTGSSRQYKQQGSTLVLTFFMSLLIIYLVLAAQFESWRDPLIILISVPLSIASALAFLMLGAASLNIYTQVGLVTLIGLIAKNGILIVEFANQLKLQKQLDSFNAVLTSAQVRLRPILMTTVSMVVAMLPLLFASGPGAVSRFDIGLVIATGLGIGTLFTLFVIPTFYLLISKSQHTHKKPELT